MTKEQIKELCKLFKISVRKRHYILLQGYIASARLIRETWNKPDSFALQSGWHLNLTRDPVTSEYTCGYTSEELMNYEIERLKKFLEENDCTFPRPRITSHACWQVLYQKGVVGSKLDFGEGGKKGLRFPSIFHQAQHIFFTQEEVISALKKLLEYIIDQLEKKKEWSSIKDTDGSIITQAKQILK